MGTTSQEQTSKLDDVSPDELVAAINDPDAAKRLMSERGWSREDLAARAEQLSRELSAGVSAINVV